MEGMIGRDITVTSMALLVLGFLYLLERLARQRLSHRHSILVMAGAFFLVCMTGAHFLLLEKWHSAHFLFNDLSRFSLGRFIPQSDAQGYYNFAELLEITGRVTSFPLFTRSLAPIYFAVFFRMFGHDLYSLFIVLNLLSAWSVFAVAFNIYRSQGLNAGFVMAFLLLLAGSSYAGLFISESPGFCFGNLAFMMVLLAYRFKDHRFLYPAYILLGLAFAFRPGAVFAVPLIILASAFHFYKSIRSRTIASALMMFVFLLGFSINSLFDRIIAGETPVPQGNFSYTLYGLAKGGMPWTTVWKDFPELKGNNNPNAGRIVYKASFRMIKSNPGQFARGLHKHWKYFVGHPFLATAKSINFAGKQVISFLFVLSCILFIVFILYDKGRNGLDIWILMFMVGIFLSFPFIRIPDDAVSFRIMAVNTFVYAYVMARIVSRVASFFRKTEGSAGGDSSKLVQYINYGFACLLLIVLTAGPLVLSRPAVSEIPFTSWTDRQRAIQTHGCSKNFAVAISRGSVLTTMGHGSGPDRNFVTSYDRFIENAEVQAWRKDSIRIDRGHALLQATELNSGHGFLIELTPEQYDTLNYGIAHFCVCETKREVYPMIYSGRFLDYKPWSRLR